MLTISLMVFTVSAAPACEVNTVSTAAGTASSNSSKRGVSGEKSREYEVMVNRALSSPSSRKSLLSISQHGLSFSRIDHHIRPSAFDSENADN